VNETIDPMEVYYFSIKVVAGWKNKGVEHYELVNTAMLGACIASKTYEPAEGKFTTHAFSYMRDELNKLVYRRVYTDKKKGTRSRRPEYNNQNIQDNATEPKDTPENLCEMQEFRERVKILSDRLTERSRYIFLEFLQTEKYEQSIKKYNLNQTKASKINMQARQSMTKWLKAFYLTPDVELID